MSDWLYQTALLLTRPLVHLRLNLRARREPAYGKRCAERFGEVPADVRPKPIWFHTVSAGETIAAAPLIQGLLKEFAQTPFLVTTMTPTGSAQVLARLADQVDHCYAPYDFKTSVQRFFDRVQPRLLVLMETELWPNIIAEASARGVPVVLVNARLSAKSAKGYYRLGKITRTMLGRLDHVACQTAEHRDRFISLGVPAEKVSVTGSVKYDLALPANFDQQLADLQARFAMPPDAPVWIAASTHPGEDELVLAAHKMLRQRLSTLRLVLVPRHPVRSAEVSSLVKDAGLAVAVQSQVSTQDRDAHVVLGDVMGTLGTLYGLGRVAFVGGSLVDMGGHNPIEPVLCGLPVVCGPFQYNFSDVMANMTKAGGLQTVTTSEELAQAVGDWLQNEDARTNAAAAALRVVAANRGAQARVMALIRSRIEVAVAVT